MKKNFFILAAVILLNASLALAEWNGDTLQPEKKDGYYLISKPAEYVWIGGNSKKGDKFKLVDDIVFGKDKNTINRERPLNSIKLISKLDFNGFSVYGAFSEYAENATFIDCFDTVVNLSYKNFELKALPAPYVRVFNLEHCKTEGDLVADGLLKVVSSQYVGKQKDGSLWVFGGGFVDGVLENRTKIEVDIDRVDYLYVYAIPEISRLGLDTSSVRGVVNYADISVKADSLDIAYVYGMPMVPMTEKFHKLANYGNITVNIKKVGSLKVSGLTEEVEVPKDVHPDVYNEGDISVEGGIVTDVFNVTGLIGVIKESYDTLIFERAVNRGNISFEIGKKDERETYITVFYKDSHIGGCFGQSERFIKNAINEGDVNVSVFSFADNNDEKMVVGGVIGKSVRCMSNRTECVSGLSNVLNMGSVYVRGDGAMAGGVVGYTNLGSLEEEDYQGRIINTVNLGPVYGTFVDYLGGVVGNLFDSDVVGVMNFGNVVTGSEVRLAGGVFGAIHGSRGHHVSDVANLGNVFSSAKRESKDSVGGITASSYRGIYWTSYNVGRVARIDKMKDFSSIIGYEPPMAYYYDWDVYYGADTLRKRIYSRYEALTPLTTKHMQSEEFVKELNYMSTQDSNAKVWKLSKICPYPIIAEVEDMLKDHQELLSIPSVRPRRAVMSLDLSVEGMNVFVSGVKAGTPYAVFNLLGHTVARGRLDGHNQMIAIPAVGTYVVKVGKASRKVTVK